jgi:hypothetical protein
MPTLSDSPRDANIDLLSRYASAVHKRDWIAMADLFTPDAAFTARRTHGHGGKEEIVFAVETPAKIVEATAMPLETLSDSHVIITNHVVDASPDKASANVSCYFRAYHAGKGERAHLFEESLGRFELETVRVDSTWKIRRLDEVVMIMLGSAAVFGLGS